MKETTKMSRAVGQIEKMFSTINNDLFEGKLPTPIITIQSLKGTWGHCTRAKVWERKDEEAYELNIAAEVADGPIEEIIDTMIHEMIHLYCRENDIKETSRGGTYHNKKFKELAESKMLICYDTGKSGWNTKGEGNLKLLEYAIEKDWTELKLRRTSSLGRDRLLVMNGNQNSPTAPASTNRSRKYQCPNCKCSVRATKEVHIKCTDCNEEMIWINRA